MKRKGFGLGLGKGYKNLLHMDSYIHSLSAKGVKTKPQFRISWIEKHSALVSADNLEEAKDIAMEELSLEETQEGLEITEEAQVCPKCGAMISAQELFLGVKSCPECGIKLDAKGKKIDYIDAVIPPIFGKDKKSFYKDLSFDEQEKVIGHFFVKRFKRTPREDPYYYEDWKRRIMDWQNPVPFMDKKSRKAWNETLKRFGLKQMKEVEDVKTHLMETVEIDAKK